ncbi:SAYSvFN domain-containing protein 1-like [Ptychodera flava]|uniref:SAYSvFN domain-containing protein 1-like n=1 Tax=Ptychodera flava TaxID=63121 RepID=UPI00396A7A67
MESQLAAYRARKAREGNYKHSTVANQSLTSGNDAETQTTQSVPQTGSNEVNSSNPTQASVPRVTQFLRRDNSIFTKPLFLKCTLWVVLLVLFIKLEFAAVFLVLTLFYLVYASMRSDVVRKPGELSAYSVFNPNCERIDGTLTAEQFEREMMYGPGSVK